MQYTEEQVLNMAPDDASAKAGQQLATNTKWGVKSISTLALWGECQGSGSTPYKTIVDLTNIAFKCSCPSRKFPCKHGLALMLLYVRQPHVFDTASAMPEYVLEWLAKRVEKEEVKELKDQKPVDEGARKKREEARDKKVSGGIEELRGWISDVVRAGIMNVPQNSYQFAQNITARMVDAQAGGLAGQLRQINKLNFFGDGWQKGLIKKLSKIYLITEVYQHKEQLPPAMVQELQTLIGWTTAKEDVLRSAPVQDSWTVLSVNMTEEDNLKVERMWLYGAKHGRYAMLLNFYAGAQLPEHLLVSGITIDAELAYFPGLVPMRALIKSHTVMPTPILNWQVPDNITSVYEKITDSLSTNPFMEQLPFMLGNVALVCDGDNWWLKDGANKAIKLANTNDECWKLLAFSRGSNCRVFGVYENEHFVLHSVWQDTKSCYIK